MTTGRDAERPSERQRAGCRWGVGAQPPRQHGVAAYAAFALDHLTV
ncbi:MAG: hypothetical protein H0X22_12325 [Acidimicrobiia bacterium]|nr:hypothetical protein [Acidimicrobiia bacterium]